MSSSWFSSCGSCFGRSSRGHTEKDLNLSPNIPTMAVPNPIIDVTPTNAAVQVSPRLRACYDNKIQSCLLAQTAIISGTLAYNGETIQTVKDQKGREYQCVGILAATWKSSGGHESSLDEFYITKTELPDNIDVILIKRKDKAATSPKNGGGRRLLPITTSEKPSEEEHKATDDKNIKKEDAQKAGLKKFLKISNPAPPDNKPNNKPNNGTN